MNRREDKRREEKEIAFEGKRKEAMAEYEKQSPRGKKRKEDNWGIGMRTLKRRGYTARR